MILSKIARISFDIIFERFFLKRKGSSDATAALITKKEYDFPGHF